MVVLPGTFDKHEQRTCAITEYLGQPALAGGSPQCVPSASPFTDREVTSSSKDQMGPEVANDHGRLGRGTRPEAFSECLKATHISSHRNLSPRSSLRLACSLARIARTTNAAAVSSMQ